jgi:HAD superfamily hydrolase (TIGR01549 family)
MRRGEPSARAVFFDFGGTLVEPIRDPYEVYEQSLEPFGVSMDRGRFQRVQAEEISLWWPRVYASLGRTTEFWNAFDSRILDRLGITERRAELLRALLDAFTSPRWHRPYPESEEVLQELQRRGHPLHLVSNNTELLTETVRRLGWDRWFASITVSQETGAEKPDPAIFRLAAHRAGLPPREILHVGDSWTADVEGARGVGIPVVWLDRAGLGPRRGAPRISDLRGILRLV